MTNQMDCNVKKQGNINPRKTTNILSKITFWHTGKLFAKGFKRELEEEDLYDVLPEFETSHLGDRIEQEWNLQRQRKNCTIGMFIIFWKMFGLYYCLLSLLVLTCIVITISRPIILGRLIYYFVPGQTELTKTSAYLFSILLIGTNILEIVCRQNYYYYQDALTIKIRTAVCSLVYRKLLRFPVHRLPQISLGEIISLITRDVNVFQIFFISFTFMWSQFATAVISCYNLYRRIGLSAGVIVIAFIIVVPLQVYFGKWVEKLKRVTSNKTDHRIDITQEILTHMRSTKMYVWESYVRRKVITARREEMTVLLKLFGVLFGTIGFGVIIHNLMFYFLLMTCLWLGQTLTTETIFFIVGTLHTMSLNFSASLPIGVFYSSQVITAIKRMQAVMDKLEEKIDHPKEFSKTKHPKIQLKNVTIKIEDNVILQNINFEIRSGLSLLTGCGSCGKSVLLMTILKEIPLSTGEVVTDGRISYVSQDPWLFPSTIRQNIIFGSEYDEKRYREVIKACALEYDFALLEKGDSTIVADRGVNLSMGQQSRINLARAVYKDCDIYLLDNCLSSVDSLVARYIFVNCILKFLQQKMVILVTHNLTLKEYAHNLLTIENGTLKILSNSEPKKLEADSEEVVPWNNIFNVETMEIEDNSTPKSKLIKDRKSSDKIYAENKRSGSVSLDVYKIYIKLGGGILYFFMTFCIFIFAQFSTSYKDKIISDWANLEDQLSLTNTSSVNSSEYIDLWEERNIFFYKYTGAVICICCGTVFRGVAVFIFSKKLSVNLHKNMLNAILKAPLKFFDRNFIGNIVNRFSKDLVNVDENIPFPFFQVAVIVFETFGILILISFTDPRLWIPVVVLLSSLIGLRYIYLKTGRPLKRLEATTKSPVLGYLNATFEGLLSIKVFRADKSVNTEFERYHNLYNSASYLHLSCLRFYVYIVEFFISLFIGVIILAFVIFGEGVSPGQVGLVITQAFILGIAFFFGIQQGAELETQMTSVERAIEYTNIENERKVGTDVENWPNHAKIMFQNVYLSMNDSESYVLKNINFAINPKEKVGIVGRTGAGKSSLISALFRLYEFKGKIIIDGTDINTLSLDFLRSSISVIPQDPVLFDGTIRENIDPGKLRKDVEIWKAIETVKLNDIILSLDVNIKNLNFTGTQKQLICLARVLIKNSKILVLHEVVENVDSETESLIYDIISNCFESCTVLTIAHRLEFVMSCDKILVLQNGEVVQYDRPNVLLQDKNGLFYKMVHNSDIESS